MLVAGAVLAAVKRTVSQALWVMGLAEKPESGCYHDVLSRVRWNGRAAARTLLARVLDAFLPAGEVVVGVDDTIERRWGPKIKARGIYRDRHFQRLVAASHLAGNRGAIASPDVQELREDRRGPHMQPSRSAVGSSSC